jgi:molybdenum cofactor biosynthesis enzyme MoaA
MGGKKRRNSVTLIIKNRNRGKYTFANINLLGKCNADCFFCLGKDIPTELEGKDQLNQHFLEWKNFQKFLEACWEKDIKNLYLTGQTADGLQYKYLDEIVEYLQRLDAFRIGVRTNGYLALSKMNTIIKMRGEIGYSIHTLNPYTAKLMMKKPFIPKWEEIIPLSGDNVRVSIVINRYNIGEIYRLLNYIARFKNVKYIQLRRISTDTRYEELKVDIEAFENFYQAFARLNEKKGEFNLAPVYDYRGKDIVFWRTVETSANSLNYFTDGTCSDEYFVVEGYLKNMERSEK